MDKPTHLTDPISAKQQPPQWITPRGIGWAVFSALCLGSGALVLVVPLIYVLLGILGTCGVLLLIYFPFLGALGYLVFEYARVSAMYPVLQQFQSGKVLVVAVFAAWFVKHIATRSVAFVKDRVNAMLILWLGLAFASIGVAMNTKLSLEGASELAKWVITYFLIIHLVDTQTKWRWFLWTLVLLNLKLSQFQLRSYAYGIQQTDWREHFIHQGVGAGTTSFLANSSDFGAAMVVVVPFGLYLMLASKNKWLKALGLVSLVAFCMSILRTGSRGAAVALLAMAVMYWVWSRQKLARGVVVVAFCALYWVMAPQEWQERFIAAKDVKQDLTVSSRLDFWTAGLGMMANHPLTGVGILNFGQAFASGGGGRAIAPHNIFIQAGSELGLPGLAVLAILLYQLFARNASTMSLSSGNDPDSEFRRYMARALQMSSVGFIVAGFFLTILQFPHIFILLALTVSLNQIARGEHLARKEEEVQKKADACAPALTDG